ncbi:MAG: T9SS type A sorting domain-containing protein, partial [Cyclobacteriaceae bacterium]|nr:T9SS type A sorting domain-containing protein [Cyclobacteriaceae bacterium]
LNGTDYEYVVKKFLPNSGGTKFPLINPDEVITVDQSWTPDLSKFHDPATQVQVIVFVQNEDTKEIYQSLISSQFFDISTFSTVTGVGENLFENITLYPNPTNHSANLIFPVNVSEKHTIRMFNNFGQQVWTNQMSVGERQITIPTTDFASGVYLIQIENSAGIVKRDRLVVSHN